MGIEPTLPAWEAGVLPLNYTRSPHHTKPKEAFVSELGNLAFYEHFFGLLASIFCGEKDGGCLSRHQVLVSASFTVPEKMRNEMRATPRILAGQISSRANKPSFGKERFI